MSIKPTDGFATTGGVGFGLGASGCACVQIPFHLPNAVQVQAPDRNGVSDVNSLLAPGQQLAVRDVSKLGHPDGNGNTVSGNNDGTTTVHTPRSDVTTFGSNGQDPAQVGTLTHQLIDNSDQRTDVLTFRADGTVTTKDLSSGVITGTSPNHGSTVTFDPRTGDITSTDSRTTTRFSKNGTVAQSFRGPGAGGSTVQFDASGHGEVITQEGSFGATTPPPPKPAIPQLPHDPSAPAPAPAAPPAPLPPAQPAVNPAPPTPAPPAPSTPPAPAPAPPSVQPPPAYHFAPPAPAPAVPATAPAPAPAPQSTPPAQTPPAASSIPLPSPAPVTPVVNPSTSTVVPQPPEVPVDPGLGISTGGIGTDYLLGGGGVPTGGGGGESCGCF